MKITKSSKIIILFLFVSTLCFPIFQIQCNISKSSSLDTNWHQNWLYRAEFEITSTHSEVIINCTIKIELDSDFNYSLARTNGEDIRFTNQNDAPLAIWIERWNYFGESIIWVLIPSIEPNSNSKLYMYYGKATAPMFSNGNEVFRYFDDFEKQSIGEEPEGWYIKQREWGSFKVSSDGKSGSKCCQYIDNSTAGSCRIYRKLPDDCIGKIIEFWIKPESNISSGILCYNDGNESYVGGNTYFGHSQPSMISYYDGSYHSLDSYQAGKWYFLQILITSLDYYAQYIYNDNQLLGFVSFGVTFLGSPTKIDYLMNGGDTHSEMRFYIDAIRYRNFISNSPDIELIDYLQTELTSVKIYIFSSNIQMITLVFFSCFMFSFLSKKKKKV